MKKIIGILGIVALSTVVFSTNNSIQNGGIMNLDSLISLNTANAEDTGGSHTCYNSFVSGSTYIFIYCSNCRRQRAGQVWNPGTCS